MPLKPHGLLKINKCLSILFKQIGLTQCLLLFNTESIEILKVFSDRNFVCLCIHVCVRVKHEKHFILDQEKNKDEYYPHFCSVWN